MTVRITFQDSVPNGIVDNDDQLTIVTARNGITNTERMTVETFLTRGSAEFETTPQQRLSDIVSTGQRYYSRQVASTYSSVVNGRWHPPSPFGNMIGGMNGMGYGRIRESEPVYGSLRVSDTRNSTSTLDMDDTATVSLGTRTQTLSLRQYLRCGSTIDSSPTQNTSDRFDRIVNALGGRNRPLSLAMVREYGNLPETGTCENRPARPTAPARPTPAVRPASPTPARRPSATPTNPPGYGPPLLPNYTPAR